MLPVLLRSSAETVSRRVAALVARGAHKKAGTWKARASPPRPPPQPADSGASKTAVPLDSDKTLGSIIVSFIKTLNFVSGSSSYRVILRGSCRTVRFVLIHFFILQQTIASIVAGIATLVEAPHIWNWMTPKVRGPKAARDVCNAVTNGSIPAEQSIPNYVESKWNDDLVSHVLSPTGSQCRYWLVEGGAALGKSTAILHNAMRLRKGIVFLKASGSDEVEFAVLLRSALNIKCDPESSVFAEMCMRLGVHSAYDWHDVRCCCCCVAASFEHATCLFVRADVAGSLNCALEILSKAVAACKDSEGKRRPAVLVIDNANLLMINDGKEALIKKLQLFAKEQADAQNVIVVFVSSTGNFSQYLRGSLLLRPCVCASLCDWEWMCLSCDCVSCCRTAQSVASRMETVTLRELRTEEAVKYAKQRFNLEETDAMALVTEITGERFRDLQAYGPIMAKNSTRAQIDGV